MVHKRVLPEARNPLILPEHTPPVEILVERRRLGKTRLDVKPGQVGTSNATKAENLGNFDYAHLRVPLPKDLKGSGVFALQKNQAYPESYFLMRRSSDGYISATGMFKASFPWASVKEEEAERKYIKNLPDAGHEEVAGNVWVPPASALSIAEEYGLQTWVEALLDPEPIEQGTKEKGEIATPPRFDIPSKGSLHPQGTASLRRRRERRSVSPSKLATPSRKIASPRKPRGTRKEAKTDGVVTSLNEVLENGTQLTNHTATPNTNDVVTIEVDSSVARDNETETSVTAVKVGLPAHSAELPLPENTEDLLAKAKEMVEEANKLEGARVHGVKAIKRKADEIEDTEEEQGHEIQPVKKVKVLSEELKKERVKNKALLGLSATLAVGAIIPYFF